MTGALSPELGYVKRPELEKKLRDWIGARKNSHGEGVLLIKGPKGSGKRTLVEQMLLQAGILRSQDTSIWHSASDNGVQITGPSSNRMLVCLDCMALGASAVPDLSVKIAAAFVRILRRMGFPENDEKEMSPERFLESLRDKASPQNQMLLTLTHWRNANDDWKEAVAEQAHNLMAAGDLSIIVLQDYALGQRTRETEALEKLAPHETKVLEVEMISELELRAHLQELGFVDSATARMVLDAGEWLASELRSFWDLLALAGTEKGLPSLAGILDRDGDQEAQTGKKKGDYIYELADRLRENLMKTRLKGTSAENVEGLDQALYLSALMGERFLPGLVAETLWATLGDPNREGYENWEDDWYAFLGDEDESEGALLPLASKDPQLPYLEGDNKHQHWVYRFRNATDRWLLAVRGRKILEDARERNDQTSLLLQGFHLLREQLSGVFRSEEHWEDGLRFRIALAEQCGLPWEAGSLENQRQSAVTARELPGRIERAKRKVGSGSGALLLVRLLCWYGDILQKVGRYPGAVAALTEAYEECEKRLSEREWKDMVKVLGSLGSALRDNGEPARALVLQKKALALEERYLGDESSSYAATLGSIGVCYHDLNRLDEALDSLKRALEIRRIPLPPDHPAIATSLNNIGSVLHGQNRLDEALDCHQKALEIRRIALPPNHPAIATSLNNMGSVLRGQNRLDEALDCCQKALEILRIALPPNHPDIATSLDNMGSVLHDQNRLDEALDCCQKALEIRRIALPPNHPDIATSLNNMGWCFAETGRKEEARGVLKEALRITESILPDGHGLLEAIRKALDSVS